MARGIPSDAEHARNLAKMRERNKPTPKAEREVAQIADYQNRLTQEREDVAAVSQALCIARQINAHMLFMDTVDLERRLGQFIRDGENVFNDNFYESLKLQAEMLQTSLRIARKECDRIAKLPPEAREPRKRG